MCPAQDRFILLTLLLIISMTFVLSLTQMLVFLESILVCDVEHTSFHFGPHGSKFVCAC